MKFLQKLKKLAKEESQKVAIDADGVPSALIRTFDLSDPAKLTPPVDFTIDRVKLYEDIQTRKALMRSCRNNEARQQEELEKSKNDVVYWCNNWVWTYDPRFIPGVATIPFNLFKRQEEYLQWRQERKRLGEQGLIDKSRDMGVTWLNAVDHVWSLLFHEGSKSAFGSRKAMLVDHKGNPDSIFEKLRSIIKTLPSWMRSDIQTNTLKIINNTNGAFIGGEGGDNIGRGGRNTYYDVDEAAFIERPHLVDAALSQNTSTVFWTSTTNIWSPSNTFDQKIASGKLPIFVFDWKDDPRKDEKWYKKQCATLDPVIVAAEIDRDREANVSNNVIFAKWVRAAVDFPLLRTKEMRAGVDIANGGADSTVMVSGAFPRAQYVDEIRLAKNDIDPLMTADMVTEIARRYGVRKVIYDPIGVGAGCGGQWKRDRNVCFEAIQFVASQRPTQDTGGEFTYYEEFDRNSNELFANVRAEAWWLARQRFWKTYRCVHEGASYPDEELVSIPNHPELIRQLSQPLWAPKNQIQVESKADMAKRGVKSPDHADALIMFLWTHGDSYSPEWINQF